MPADFYFPRQESRFLKLGNVVNHPQFNHLQTLPDGLNMVVKPSFTDYLLYPISTIQAGIKAARFASDLLNSTGFRPAASYFKQHGIGRLFIVKPKYKFELLPTFPYSLNVTPWVLEIEDSTTLFHPYLTNGRTAGVEITGATWYPPILASLRHPNCLGVITHVKSTHDGLKKLFKDEPFIHSKIFYLPVSFNHELPPLEQKYDGELTCFFNNSWHQYESNFYLRGGLYILNAFRTLLKDPERKIRLILRSKIPWELTRLFREVLEDPRVKVIDHFVSNDEYMALLKSSQVYLLPSARMHVASLMEAQAYGLTTITTDGWGIEEVLRSAALGMRSPGIYGKVTWIDKEIGVLRENYAPMFEFNDVIEDFLVDSINLLDQKRSMMNDFAQRGQENLRLNHDPKKMNETFSSILQSIGVLPNGQSH
jgi:glycosyltransferase involved in cell wall biosynthesis